MKPMSTETVVTEIEGSGDYKIITENFIHKSNKANIQIKHLVCGHEFTMNRDHWVRGQRCPKCNRYDQRKTTEQFKKELFDKFGGRYILKSEYISKRTKLDVECGICGTNYQVLSCNLLNGHECPKCYAKTMHDLFVKPESKVNEIIKSIDPEYEYESGYTNNKATLDIKHLPCGHILKSTLANFRTQIHPLRCKFCKKRGSTCEVLISEFLKEKSILFIPEMKFQDCENPLCRFDFFLPTFNLCIEYDGELHYISAYSELAITQARDELKNNYCSEKGINLLRIPFWEQNFVLEVMERLFSSPNIPEFIASFNREKEEFLEANKKVINKKSIIKIKGTNNNG